MTATRRAHGEAPVLVCVFVELSSRCEPSLLLLSLQRLEREITVLLRKRVCGCHWYLLHRLGRLGPELAELAWSGPLCTQLQHTRQERHRSERAGGREGAARDD